MDIGIKSNKSSGWHKLCRLKAGLRTGERSRSHPSHPLPIAPQYPYVQHPILTGLSRQTRIFRHCLMGLNLEVFDESLGGGL